MLKGLLLFLKKYFVLLHFHVFDFYINVRKQYFIFSRSLPGQSQQYGNVPPPSFYNDRDRNSQRYRQGPNRPPYGTYPSGQHSKQFFY